VTRAVQVTVVLQGPGQYQQLGKAAAGIIMMSQDQVTESGRQITRWGRGRHWHRNGTCQWTRDLEFEESDSEFHAARGGVAGAAGPA
jgi:hypothetical protein